MVITPNNYCEGAAKVLRRSDLGVSDRVCTSLHESMTIKIGSHTSCSGYISTVY